MPQLSAIDAVSIALEHTKRQLFRPFRWGQWLRLALLGFMTGELSRRGGCSGNFPTSFPTNPQDQQGGADQLLSAPHLEPQMAAHIMLIAGVASLVVCVFALVWMYVGSVYRFILIESIITKKVNLLAGWLAEVACHGAAVFPMAACLPICHRIFRGHLDWNSAPDCRCVGLAQGSTCPHVAARIWGNHSVLPAVDLLIGSGRCLAFG